MMRNAVRSSELRYVEPKQRLYIVGQDWQFEWLPGEIKRVTELYEAGLHLADIARGVDRSPWETMMLLVDLSERGLIKERAGYLWGKR